MKIINLTCHAPRESWPGWCLVLLMCQLGFSQSPTIVAIPTLGGGTSTPYGLNALGDVVGNSYIAGNAAEHAFLFTGGKIVDLNTLETSFSVGYDINKAGQITGYFTTADGAATRPFLYQNGTMTDLGSLGGSFAIALKINESGSVAGYSLNAAPSYRGFLYAQGQLNELSTLGGDYAKVGVGGLNASGWVAGESLLPSGQIHACLWKDTGIVDLGTLGGSYSTSWGLNDSGWVTGYSYTDASEVHAFLYNGTSMLDLGSLGGGISLPYAINNLGQVAGDSYTDSGGNHGFVYADGELIDIGTLGADYSSVYDMNNSGLVIGESITAAGELKPILWEKGTMTALSDLLPADSGWQLLSAYRISDGGHIIGYGTWQGQGAWYLLSLNRNQNQPPVAVAGASQVVECAGTQTPVTLNASASRDPDGDPLRYEWYYQNALLSTNSVVSLGFALGTYQIQLRVTDPSNASADDSTSVTIVDTTAPTLVCPAPLTLAADAQCQAVIPDLLASLGVSDNCTPANKLTKVQNPPAGAVLGLGPTDVQISVTDGAGNRSSCTTTLTVVDSTPPALICPAAVTLAANNTCQAVVPDFLAGLVTADNCTPANKLIKAQNPPAGTSVGAGQTVVQITVTDLAGNVASCATTVTVQDRTAPVIQSVTANPRTLSPPNKAMVPVTITVAAIDNCGSAPVSRIISVASNEPVTGKGDTTSPDWQITGPLTVNLRAEGQNARVYTVTIQCTDPAGNSVTATVPISVEKAKPKK